MWTQRQGNETLNTSKNPQAETMDPTWKSPHSPAGQPFMAGPSNRYDLDCPLCKYGTPVPQEHGKPYKCIDCGKEVEISKLKPSPKQTK
jgi:hypothetical protein